MHSAVFRSLNASSYCSRLMYDCARFPDEDDLLIIDFKFENKEITFKRIFYATTFEFILGILLLKSRLRLHCRRSCCHTCLTSPLKQPKALGTKGLCTWTTGQLRLNHILQTQMTLVARLIFPAKKKDVRCNTDSITTPRLS